MSQSKFFSALQKIYLYILLAIFGGIVLHAPISVFGGVILPDFSLLIKSWKEILLAVAVVICLIILYKKQQFEILNNKLFILIGLFIITHFFGVVLFNNGTQASLAGLLIDLRFIIYFCLVYLAVRLFPNYKKTFIKVGLIGAVVVILFGLMQIFILPKDILKNIGYGSETIAPYLTVDENHDFVRINSTLRGPNPLGAYVAIVCSVALAWLVGEKRDKKNTSALLLFGGLIVLWFTYSRSAILAMLISCTVILALVFKKLNKKIKRLILGSFVALALVGSLLAFSNPTLMSNIILHEDPGESVAMNSNDGHLESLADGFSRMLIQPFGAGIGSTGSASLYGEKPFIIENQYLFIAHEVGWAGLVLFCLIFFIVMKKIWSQRSDWLALGVLASGLGLVFVGLLLPVWVDDTVSIVWWGLAAVIIGYSYDRTKIEQKSA